MLRLLDEHVQPDAQVRGDHVHQAETGEVSMLDDQRLRVHENEVKLEEGEADVAGG